MEHTRTVTRELETGPNAVLHVEARSGAVVVEGSERASVRIDATVRVWSDIAVEADEAASLVARGIEQDGHRAIVRAPSLPQSEGWGLWGRRGSRVEYTVAVPRDTAVRVLSRSGRIDIAHTAGRVHAECGSGRVSIEDVEGPVTAITRSGGISASRIRGDALLEARSGRVEAREIDGKAKVESRSGAVDLREVAGDLTVRAHTGVVTVERPGAGVEVRTQTGAIRYEGAVSGDVSIQGHTASIHLAVDPAVPFFLDAESAIGTVRSELPPRRGSPPSSDGQAPKVRVRTHPGSIRITRL